MSLQCTTSGSDPTFFVICTSIKGIFALSHECFIDYTPYCMHKLDITHIVMYFECFEELLDSGCSLSLVKMS